MLSAADIYKKHLQELSAYRILGKYVKHKEHIIQKKDAKGKNNPQKKSPKRKGFSFEGRELFFRAC